MYKRREKTVKMSLLKSTFQEKRCYTAIFQQFSVHDIHHIHTGKVQKMPLPCLIHVILDVISTFPANLTYRHLISYTQSSSN